MNMWTDKTAAQATQGKTQGMWQAMRVEIDSRRIKPGDLFIALKGENFDGHDFVKDAFAKGAAAAVVSRPLKDSPLLIVPDTLKALEGLGKFARKRTKAKVVGITGSVGKTSAKEMLRLMLSAHGKVFATNGNYNNHIGTPLNLANLPMDCDFAVFEMGMNHAGEIAHLTCMVEPQVAAITNVEVVHLEFFDSIDGIARAKSEIFDGMIAGGTAILNADSPQLAVMKNEAVKRGIKNIVTFGETENADCRLFGYGTTPTGCEVTASIHGKTIHYTLAAIGRHWALTSVMTLAITHALGLDDIKTAKALASFSELEGRGRISQIGDATLIDDSYNASPSAMKAAFAKANEVWRAGGKKGRKLAALGDMLELGGESQKLHTALVPELQAQQFDVVFTAGAMMKHLHDALPSAMRAGHAAHAKDLTPLILKELRAGDILLVKGSHGSKMYEVAKTLLEHNTVKEKKHAV
jgi:UDP-N-acetylmuramoyl-tripeptide--D-alanyl-D-alanine ligase